MTMLNNKNFLEFAAKAYANPRCLSMDEFFEDLARIRYVKRLLGRYLNKGELQERLILNHLISFYNVFGVDYANQMMFFRCEEEMHSALKTFLVYLNYLPEDMYVEIPLDQEIVERLRKL